MHVSARLCTISVACPRPVKKTHTHTQICTIGVAPIPVIHLSVATSDVKQAGEGLLTIRCLPAGLTLEVPSGSDAETVASAAVPEVTSETEPGKTAKGAASTAKGPAAAAADAAAAAAAAAVAQLPPVVTEDVRQQASAVAEPLVKPLPPPFLGDEEGPSAQEMMMWRALPFAALFVGAVAVMWWWMAPPRRSAQRFHSIPTLESRS